MKIVVRIAMFAAALLMLAGCSQGNDAEQQAEPGDTSPEVAASPAGGSESSGCAASESLTISAKDSTFDKDCLAAPADKAFKVTFNNTDAFGHSFSVYEKEGGEQLYRGEIFGGPKELVNEIPALEAGTYHYQCDVHPFVMQGSLKVG